MNDSDDENLWAYVTKDVTPIEREQSVPDKKQRRTSDQGSKNSETPSAPLTTEQSFVFKDVVKSLQPDELDRRTAERLRRGQIEIEARIDLHGMRQHEAHQALRDFILRAQSQGYRCVLVITGKGEGGEGVLRRNVPGWLSQMPGILKAQEAQPKDGGFGALYVYLKRQR